MAEKTYDLIIVGGGTAGCILAARIAEKGVHPRTKEQLRVALLEAGPYYKGDPRPGYGIPLRRQMFTNVHREFDAYTAQRYVIPGGTRILGGSSVSFGGQSNVPFSVDYANWNYTTGVDWTEQNMKAAAEEVRRVFNLHADPEDALSDGQKRFRQAALSLGYDVRPFEGAKKNCIFCGYCFTGNMCKYDAKMSTLLTHVPAAERHGVEIISDAMAKELVIAGNKVTGVIYERDGQKAILEGDHFILSCGSIQTPLLLWNSGIGPRDVLGSRTRIESRNVGRRTHVHAENYIYALFPGPIKEGDRGWNAGSYFLHRMNQYGHDALFVQDSGMGGIPPTPEDAAVGEFAPEFGKEHKMFMNTGRRSIGRIVLWTNPSTVEGHLDEKGVNVYDTSHPTIVTRLREGIDISIEILKTMGATRWTPPEKLIQSIRAPHAASSCRAGTDPRESAVDTNFRLHGLENVFVCDAGVLPRNPVGQVALVVATVATFAAYRIAENHFS